MLSLHYFEFRSTFFCVGVIERSTPEFVLLCSQEPFERKPFFTELEITNHRNSCWSFCFSEEYKNLTKRTENHPKLSVDCFGELISCYCFDVFTENQETFAIVEIMIFGTGQLLTVKLVNSDWIIVSNDIGLKRFKELITPK